MASIITTDSEGQDYGWEMIDEIAEGLDEDGALIEIRLYRRGKLVITLEDDDIVGGWREASMH